MSGGPREEVLDELYSAPLAEFIQLRNVTVKTLKAQGRKEEAAEVKALRKPSTAAWVVNQLHFRHPEAVAAMTATSQALRDAHHGGGTDLAAAMSDRRDRMDELLETAKELLEEAGVNPTRDQMRRVGRTLEAATAAEGDPTPGRLVEDLEPAGFGALAGLTLAASPAKRSSGRSTPKPTSRKAPGKMRRTTTAPRSRARAAERRPPEVSKPDKEAEISALQAALDVEETKLGRAEREHTRAETALGASMRHIERSRSKIDDLEGRLAKARETLAEAEAEAEQRKHELGDAEDALARARARVDAARKSVDSARD